MQFQRTLHATASPDGNLAYAPLAPAALLLLRDILLLSYHLLLVCFQHLPKNPRTHASFSVVEWEQIHFLSHEKCSRAQKLSSNILCINISRSFLEEHWNKIWTGIKALLTEFFLFILIASEWGPIRETGICSNGLWWIIKAFPRRLLLFTCSFIWVRRLSSLKTGLTQCNNSTIDTSKIWELPPNCLIFMIIHILCLNRKTCALLTGC